mmetsp:Transcript_6035/g.18945  ORF Transcript_6035/g.18945 Transcript_6035/m.18945 type:complete len:130 (-) Transcript_6035:107-496(-)
MLKPSLVLLSLFAAMDGFSPPLRAPRTVRRRAELDPAEGDVVLYRASETAELDIGVVMATMSCTQWIQPLLVADDAGDELTLVEDSTAEPVQCQGLLEAIVDAEGRGPLRVQRSTLPDTLRVPSCPPPE